MLFRDRKNKRKGHYNVKEAESKALTQQQEHHDDDSVCVEIDHTSQKPKIAPKPVYTIHGQSKASPSLSDSARGRSQSSSESEASDTEDCKMAVPYQVHNTADGNRQAHGNFYTQSPTQVDTSV